MSLKIKMAQQEIEEGDLQDCRKRVKDMGYVCELAVDWASFKTEEECKKVYNYAYSDIESALSGLKGEKLVLSTINSSIKKIEVGMSDAETKMSLNGETLRIQANFANNGFVESSKVRDFLMNSL